MCVRVCACMYMHNIKSTSPDHEECETHSHDFVLFLIIF